MTRSGLSRHQKIQKGIIKPAPLKFEMSADEIKQTESHLDSMYNNSLSQNQIKLVSGQRQLTLGHKQTVKTYTLVFAKNQSEKCEVNFTSVQTLDHCKQIQTCDQEIKKCLKQLGVGMNNTQNKKESSEDVVNVASLFKEDSNEVQTPVQTQNKKESSEDVVNIASLFKEDSEEEQVNTQTQDQKESSEDAISIGSLFEENYNTDEYSHALKNKSQDETHVETQVQVDLSDEEKQDKPLLGGFQPCNESEEDLLHESLIHLQKYAYLTFDHLYVENIVLCSHQFFARSNNVNFMLSFDSTQKCSMSLNIEWDPVDNKRKVRKVTVYQDEGDEKYGIFARNPVKRIGLEFPDCADYFGTPLYRMSLDHYKNLESYKQKKDAKLAKLSQTREHKHDKI